MKIEGTDLPAVEIGNSGTLKVGQRAIAIGSPLGTFTNSVTTGVVSAMGRRIDVADECSRSGQIESLRDLIQTDAAINPGNSGGALVDVAGASSASTRPSPGTPRASASPSPSTSPAHHAAGRRG